MLPAPAPAGSKLLGAMAITFLSAVINWVATVAPPKAFLLHSILSPLTSNPDTSVKQPASIF